jgi:hypothetical protein
MSTPFLICTAVGVLSLLLLGVICIVALCSDTYDILLRTAGRYADVPGQLMLFAPLPNEHDARCTVCVGPAGKVAILQR